jgi:hypothetical protein
LCCFSTNVYCCCCCCCWFRYDPVRKLLDTPSIYKSDEIKDDRMSGACSTHGRDE